jgi:citrate lyase subunit beta / citryl-CoA lyase
MEPLRYRSKLVVDGCDPGEFGEAFASDADSIMFENEEHVPRELKPAARQWITDFMSNSARREGKLVQIRVNAVWSDYYRDDLSAFVIHGVDIIVLPKVELPEHVIAAAEAIDAYERDRRLPGIGIVATIETPKALRLVSEIARSHPRLRGLQIGYEDLFKQNGISPSSGAADIARFQIKMAAAEAGINAFDGRYTTDTSNLEMYRLEALNAVGLGFTGKTCSDADQIAIANEVFPK